MERRCRPMRCPESPGRFAILKDSARYPSGPRERSAKPPFVGSNPTRASRSARVLGYFASQKTRPELTSNQSPRRIIGRVRGHRRALVPRGTLVFCLRRQHRKSFSATRQLADAMLSLGMTLSLLFLPPPFQAQTSPSPEHQAKAHLLSKFPIFVEWPENALPIGRK